MVGAAFPVPVTLDTLPGNGSKAVSIRVIWNTVPIVGNSIAARVIQNINLLSQFQSGQFNTVQAVYIDNLTCAYGVVLQSLESGQKLTCPPFSSGTFPLLCGPSPQFSAEIQGQFFFTAADIGNSSTSFHFLNTPARTYVNQGAGIFPVNAPNPFLKSGAFTNDAAVIMAGELGTPTVPGGLDVPKHYLIDGFSFTLTMVPPPAPGGNFQGRVLLQAQGNSGPQLLFAQRVMADMTTNSAVMFNVNISFATPILVADGGNAIVMLSQGFSFVPTMPWIFDGQLYLSIVRIE